jgi:hypothetical protein
VWEWTLLEEIISVCLFVLKDCFAVICDYGQGVRLGVGLTEYIII